MLWLYVDSTLLIIYMLLSVRVCLCIILLLLYSVICTVDFVRILYKDKKITKILNNFTNMTHFF